MYDILQLNDMLVPQLKELAERMGISGFRRLPKQDLIYKILDHQALNSEEAGAKEKDEAPAAVKEQVKEPAAAPTPEEASPATRRTYQRADNGANEERRREHGRRGDEGPAHREREEGQRDYNKRGRGSMDSPPNGDYRQEPQGGKI